MKRIYLMILVALTVSCNQKTGSNKISKESRDTLIINNKTYYLDSISEQEFNSVSYQFPSETDTIALDTSLINIAKDSIIIKTKNKIVTLKNDTTMNDTYAKYKYLKTYNNIGFVHLKGSFWEWTEDILVNLSDGEITSLVSNPIISPDKKLLISYNVDLIAQFMMNGIELYNIENGRLEKVFIKEISSWGPEEIKWESNKSIVIKRKKVDFASQNFTEHFDFRRMIIE